MIRKKTYRIPALFFTSILSAALQISAQNLPGTSQGNISYITSQNIYVKFESTEAIENGDTLFILQNEVLVPALVVQHHSSISCLCMPLENHTFQIADIIFVKKKRTKKNSLQETPPESVPEKDISEHVLTSQEKEREENFSGRLSFSSYSNFANTSSADAHRFRYTFSSKADNISNSNLSAETYISFTHKQGQWNLVRENLNNALKIYNLALKYEWNKSATLWAGRKINPVIANVGAIDGLQFEYNFGKIFTGIVAGSRPDFEDYGYNFNLFEYGGYFGQKLKVKNGFVQTSLAVFEQRNNAQVDRRFAYFQHTNSAVKNLHLFSSIELDLYKLENNQPKNTLNLISLYFSVSYRISRRISLSGLYDNRKNVIYYETFRNYADEVLQQASRQGIRFRVNYRPVNYLTFGINAGTRFKKEDPRPTKTLNGYGSCTRIPGINTSVSISGSLMQTGYLDGHIYGVRFTKDIIPGKIFSMLHYRHAEFKYSKSSLKQNIAEIDFSYRLNKKWYWSVNFEITESKNDFYNRLYFSTKYNF
ncbi:hypothetical protein D1164_07290 [Mariniphaga sediminis]|uniref:DUF560 domain-containing protein n=1 Tax=Mariniphaga sediminis TaxID=1628158 RepID=A0A399D4E6_9BACT|nr:hypothetical protein [Mariniphaga sediminis]RIH66058.1 hypothetical protein D1164_07290 [Mariniphaga sediminis]